MQGWTLDCWVTLRFITIQVCPKDLDSTPGQAERAVPARRRSGRQDSPWNQARRYPGRTTDDVQARRKPQGRQGAWLGDSRIIPAARRRGHRITRCHPPRSAVRPVWHGRRARAAAALAVVQKGGLPPAALDWLSALQDAFVGEPRGSLKLQAQLQPLQQGYRVDRPARRRQSGGASIGRLS
jgi:hypothetical protein